MEKVNKTELKNFAIQSRRQLIDQVKTKALLYGIDEKNSLEIKEQFGQLMINDKPYPLYMKQAFNSLKNQLQQKGYKQLVEEVAYTWFNRIIAIRYMEVHDYLPEKVNVLSSSVGQVDPDILFEYETLDLPVKQEEIRELLDAGDTEGAYRKLFIAQCNALNSILPFLFEQIQDYTELLLPDFLLDAQSVIKVLVQNDELTNSFEEIEVIGWLYQYYIAEEKDRVFAQKSKYKKEEIPFATQLFTPKWIVQYMVQNSLGRYWTEAHREDEDLISNWEYFIKHEEEDFHEKIEPYVNKELRVEDIKLLDPAMGSGHILVYAFEVFHQIYEKCGYPERDIPRLIIENNLYGLDIDDRAYQLSAFAVIMKAASYSRRFLRSVEREGIQINLASIQETNHISDSVIAYIAKEEEGEQYNQVKAFFKQYENAKIYGSLINITERDMTFIEERLEHIQNNPVEDLFFSEQHDIAKELLAQLIQQTEIMRNEYDLVVMNPPYLGNNIMNKELSSFLNKHYSNSKMDLYSAFMDIDFLLKENGIYSAINQQSWMFLGSYESLRKKMLDKKTIVNMIHLGTRTFDEVNGEVVQSTCFTIRNTAKLDINSIFFNLTDFNSSNLKKNVFLNKKEEVCYVVHQSMFYSLPSYVLSYWCDQHMINIFKNKKLGDYATVKKGMDTGENAKFVRLWHEVNINKFSIKNINSPKWFPYSKGGKSRKWYGNTEYIVNWENNGVEIKKHPKSTIRNENLNYLENITWSDIGSGNIGGRYIPSGYLRDNRGPAIFSEKENLLIILALLNSNLAEKFQKIINPTMCFQVGNIKSVPLKPDLFSQNYANEIINLSKLCLKIAKEDWDSQEISWDFYKHFLLGKNHKISEAFNEYLDYKNDQYKKLVNAEKRLNVIINDIYEINDYVDDSKIKENIDIIIFDKRSSVSSLLSYFIGCLLGRYTINTEGLMYAGGEWNENNYTSFKPNKNGIIHFTENPYFENDIIIRLREFLSVAFSPDAIDVNIQWLADSLEMKNGEDAEARLRRYFLDEFFAEHCKMYQKRPIYWLVDSGKQKGLRSLIYMHRYQPDTMATIRFEHLQEIQAKYQNEITDLENRLVNPNLSASEKKKLTAEKISFEKKMDELREFDKRLAEIANEEIEIDLDDGVKVNYEKFYRGGKGVLAKIK